MRPATVNTVFACLSDLVSDFGRIVFTLFISPVCIMAVGQTFCDYTWEIFCSTAEAFFGTTRSAGSFQLNNKYRGTSCPYIIYNSLEHLFDKTIKICYNLYRIK